MKILLFHFGSRGAKQVGENVFDAISCQEMNFQADTQSLLKLTASQQSCSRGLGL